MMAHAISGSQGVLTDSRAGRIAGGLDKRDGRADDHGCKQRLGLGEVSGGWAILLSRAFRQSIDDAAICTKELHKPCQFKLAIGRIS